MTHMERVGLYATVLTVTVVPALYVALFATGRVQGAAIGYLLGVLVTAGGALLVRE